MSIEVRPLGVGCNIRCHYCYQNPQREAGGIARSYDLEKIKDAILEENKSFTLFGGEALLVPIDDLEELWKIGVERFGHNSIQTNGVLISDRHIELFRKYKVAVGVSIDGPDELNDVRWAGSLEATRKATSKTQAAIERLCNAGLNPSLIITLHRGNAVGESLQRMAEWLFTLRNIGIKSVRLHILEVDNPLVKARYELTNAENIDAFLFFARLEPALSPLRFDVFDDIRNLLMGNDEHMTCVWAGCDPYTTSAVRGIEGFGQRSNCGRTNKEGIDFVKSESEGFERYIALYHTPQSDGGCADCKYFSMCKGQCPGTSINGDWRNRSANCLVWKALFEYLEKELTQASRPLVSDSERRQVESDFIERWSNGKSWSIRKSLVRIRTAEAAVAV